MDAVMSNSDYKHEYVTQKVQKWINDVDDLATIAKDEPQAVYTSFTKAIAHRWSYVQRTIPGVSNLFIPLEEAIRERLIPALIGRKVSDIERRILALPVRFGGMGFIDPTKTAECEFEASSRITSNLSRLIFNQEQDYDNYDKEQVNVEIKAIKALKDERYQNEFNDISNSLPLKSRRILEMATENGVGAWLNALPIKSLGYTLNKQEFRDSVCLRYGWQIPNTPTYCQCSEKNSIDHALSCKLGGYVHMRHNRIRDLEADLMKEIGHDVKIEPELLPLETDKDRRGNNKDKARLDVSGVGVWGSYERTFLDIRVVHPNAPSYINKPIKKIYETHEKEKKRAYNERVIQVEKGSFTPIVVSTFGGMGAEAERYHKRIATLISEKRNERYSDVLNYLRTRLRFSILRSVLTAVRGVRGKSSKETTTPISEISYNLIAQYE